MPLLIQCPNCKRLLGPTAKLCRTKTGKGCGKSIPHDRKIYYAQWRDPHGRTRQKKIGPTKKAAENFLRKVETAIVEERYIDKDDRPQIKISDFIAEHYRPWCQQYNRRPEQKEWYLKAIINEWGDKNLDELTDKDVDQLRWKAQKAKTRTNFNRLLSCLSHLYTVAIEYGLIDRQPFTTARKRFKEKARLRYLLPAEAVSLLKCCTGHLHPIVATALHTGMRRGEILGLRLGVNVDLKARRITLHQTKNDEVRHLPINSTLFDVLTQAAADKSPGDYLFANGDGEPYKDIRTSFAGALERAKIIKPHEQRIKDFHFHDLRHTFASNLVMAGVDLFVVKELLGHKDIKMTLKYAHLSPHHQNTAVAKLDEIFTGNEAKRRKKEDIA